jgi:4-hydroxybenzoate polyprenyltransferase
VRKGFLLFNQVELLVISIPAVPFYVGWVLASGELWPTSLRFYLGLLSMFPLLGTGTVLLNDAYDQDVDANSRRKSRLSSSIGILRSSTLSSLAWVSFAAALALAAAASLLLLANVVVLVLLAIAYSVPPVRLSRRPFIDLAANIIGIGVLCTIGGWVLEEGASLPPVAWMFTSAFGTGTIFLFLALMDMDSDKAGGKTTTAVRLGWRGTCLLGLALIATADAGIVYMSLASVVLNPTFLYVAVPIILLELSVFPALLNRRESLEMMTMVMSGLILGGTMLILLSHLGRLGPF